MILLTALPRTGKTTAIKKIIQMLGSKNCGGFFTEELKEDGERVGFMIKTLSGKTGLLSHVNFDSKYKISKYGVDLDNFEKICLNELNNSINNDNIKYIIIDEIGPMQLFSTKYKKILNELLHSKKQVIGTIFMNSYEWLDDFKKNNGIDLIEINLENRNELPLKIVKMVTKGDEVMQRKINKALKYSNEMDRFVILDDCIEVHSEHGIRTIRKEKLICDCDYFKTNGTCSHIMALVNSNILNK